MPRKDRSQYIDFPVSGKWRVRFYEEDNDFVISLEHLPDEKCILRFDQSKHDEFHSDLRDVKYEIFKGNLSFEQKVGTAFDALKRYSDDKKITEGSDTFEYSSLMDGIRNQILNKEVPKGTDRNTRSFTVGAYIVNPSIH